jgi:hypothetical protein
METPASDTPKRRSKWLRIPIYMLAGMGLLFIALIVAFVIHERGQPDHTLDANDTVDGVMTRNYGKYSEAQQGWLYVDEQNHASYVVTVVQQKKIEGKEGDELYLVTSGRPLDPERSNGPFYGVFQLRWRDGKFYEYSDAYRYEGTEPVTPERVRFEALSADVWGWVVKTFIQGDADEAEAVTRNVVLAPHGDQIAVLADFYAARELAGNGGCEETERRHAAWEQAHSVQAAASAPAEGASAPAGEGGAEDMEPIRCTKLQWSYRTDPVGDSTFTPLYVTRKAGMLEGKPMPEKTWKVMFDPKSFTYRLPDELKDEPEGE